MDYSFLKIYDSLSESILDTEFKNSEFLYFTTIVLNPKETYLQLTAYDGGLSFSGLAKVEVVDCNNNVLLDITDNVFIEEFIDADGNTQNAIEYVNIGQNFYGKDVFLRFYVSVNDTYYYTNPIKINDNTKDTYRFDYTNSSNLWKIPYENANYTQSIRIDCKFKGFNNQSENSSYYQISNGNVISSRVLKKISNQYLLENMTEFSFERLQKVFEHDTIYIDGVRITDNPIIDADERKGQTNMFDSTFEAYLDKADKFTFEYQIAQGLELTDTLPMFNGYYTLDNINNFELTMNFNSDIVVNQGIEIKIFDKSDNSLVGTIFYDDVDVTGNTLITNEPLFNFVSDLGDYYITISLNDIYSELYNEYYNIIEPDVWEFTVSLADFDSSDFDGNDFLTD